MIGWKRHVDHQIKKVLTIQLQRTLKEMYRNLPETKVELVYRNQELQLRPSLEDIRSAHYAEIRKVLDCPTKIRSLVNPNSYEFFADTLDACQSQIAQVYGYVEGLLKKLMDLIEEQKVLKRR